MKPLTYLKSFWSSSLFQRSVFGGILLWLALQLPLLIISYSTSVQRTREYKLEQQASIEKILVSNLSQAARFGDVVNSRVQTLELGRLMGLKDLIICEAGNNITGKLFEASCPPSSNRSQNITINNKDLTVFFIWEIRLESIADILGTTSIYASLLSLLIVALTALVTYSVIASKVRGLSKELAGTSVDNMSFLLSEKEPEFLELRKAIIATQSRLQSSILENQSLRSREAMAQLAEQVAHDIRSPLSVIRLVTSTIAGLPSDKKQLLENASARVNDIANDLLLHRKNGSKNRIAPLIERNDSSQVESFEVEKTIDRIIDEKQFSLPREKRISFVRDSRASADSTLHGSETEFERALSNLINNSIESISSEGQIRVGTRCSAESFTLIISDTGCGIEQLAIDDFLRNRKMLSTKENGNSIGLSHALSVVESMKGRMLVQSKINLGTLITLIFPKRSN